MYKLSNTTSIIRISDNATIPNDTANTDYAKYLEWAKTNTAAPADLPTTAQIDAPLIAALLDIDMKSIRALREGDTVQLKALDDQAKVARGKIK